MYGSVKWKSRWTRPISMSTIENISLRNKLQTNGVVSFSLKVYHCILSCRGLVDTKWNLIFHGKKMNRYPIVNEHVFKKEQLLPADAELSKWAKFSHINLVLLKTDTINLMSQIASKNINFFVIIKIWENILYITAYKIISLICKISIY